MLEDIEEIKRLKARYCAYCDDEFDADRIASLFTEDAVWDGGMRGKAEGREAIRSFFSLAPEGLSFARHMVMNPVIQVEGDTAKASWYLLECCTYVLGNQAVWGAVRYDEEYLRVDGEWKIKRLRVTSFFGTPFEQGWVKRRFFRE